MKKNTILCIDWDKLFLEELEFYLLRKGFRVITSSQYCMIEDLIRLDEVDLVLLEISAPVPESMRDICEETNYGRFTGLVILKEILQRKPDLKLPPIAAGISKVLYKPTEPSKLVRVIKMVIKKGETNDRET